MGHTSIRHAVLADAASIARVHVASWKVAYGGFMPRRQMAWISEQRETRRAAELIENPDTPFLVAEVDEAVVGFMVYGPPGDECDPATTSQIYTFFVDPARYRQGIGTTLLEAMESAITVSTITVWVMKQGTHGPAFYVRHGFLIEPETEKMFGLVDKEFPIVRYSKTLRSNR
jgi:ribosomal protein S18 acetylase RimI-like enzyme